MTKNIIKQKGGAVGCFTLPGPRPTPQGDLPGSLPWQVDFRGPFVGVPCLLASRSQRCFDIRLEEVGIWWPPKSGVGVGLSAAISLLEADFPRLYPSPFSDL